MWDRGYKLIDIGHELKIAPKNCVDWASFCREVCLVAFVDHPEKIGGPEKTVEIDESKFGRRKNWKGHRVEGVWVFGGIERESGRVFMECVEKRSVGREIRLGTFELKRCRNPDSAHQEMDCPGHNNCQRLLAGVP